MKRKISIFLFSIILMLLLGIFESISACSCEPIAPCQNYQNADVIFFGKAVEMKHLDNNSYEVYFEVVESFKNPKTDRRVKVSSNSDEGVCGYRFELNQTYLSSQTRISKGKRFGIDKS